jgi:hypothetical protein
LFEVCRYDNPKDFRQRRPDGSWSVKGIRKVPYRLPELMEQLALERTVVIVEGEKDVDALWSIGVPATCNSGGAGKWRDALSKFFHGADVVIIPDRDPQKRHQKTGELMFHPDGRPMLPGQDHGQAVAAALHGIAARVRVLELWKSWPDMPPKGDVSDWIESGGTAEQLYALIEKLPNWSPPGEHETAQRAKPEEESEINIEVARLAKLPAIKYEKERKTAAEALGCRASVLDRLVQDERERLGGDVNDGRQGRAISFPDPELWAQPVDGAALLDEIAATLKRYVIMDEHARYSAALWVVHTYLLDAFMITPRLAVRSPMKRCGKTTLLDVLSCLVLKALPTANVSAAALFRVIESYQPCLLVDEADTFLAEANELRGILNSGHRRGGSVLRTVGDDHEPRAFATYAPVAIGIIGVLPDTLADRSISVDLKRKLLSEVTESFRIDRVGHLEVLARKAARWAADNSSQIAVADPEMPPGVHSREADNWKALFSIAEVAGGEWPKRVRAAATQAAAVRETASQIELLLGDIRDIFAKREADKVEPVDRMPSGDLVAALVGIEGRPWAELGKTRKPLTQNRLARLLKPLIIAPENIRVGDKVPKGYLLERFEEAFSRYLGLAGASEPLHGYKADELGASAGFQSATAEPDVAVRKCEKSTNDGPCSDVAAQKGEVEEKSPHVTFFGVEPFGSCVQCGTADGIVHHVRDNRHLDRRSINLHEACVAGWFTRRQEGNGTADGGDKVEFRTCAQCHGEIDGKERLVSVSGGSAWLHPECQRFWLAALDEGQSLEGEA